MSLDRSFVFSQSSLQDYVDCRRRFYLRYIQRLVWPAVESQPILENERYILQGQRFHLMIQQNLCGVPAERLTGQAGAGELGQWWGNYLAHIDDLLPTGCESYPELTLAGSSSGFRLLAKYDLVQRLPGSGLRIIDWKTARNRPPRSWLASRIQTRLYPYLLTRLGQHLNGGQPVNPGSVEMVYWFAGYPEQPERFPYSEHAYQEDESYLASLLITIQSLDEAEFYLTSDEKLCSFCVYRSLCERGIQAGFSNEMEGRDLVDFDMGMDLDQITEISL